MDVPRPRTAVTVEITTGAHRVITYLLSPLRRFKQDSARALSWYGRKEVDVTSEVLRFGVVNPSGVILGEGRRPIHSRAIAGASCWHRNNRR